MTKKINVNLETLKKLYGSLDANIRFIEKEFNVRASITDEGLEISGSDEQVVEAEKLIYGLIALINQNIEIDRANIRQAIDIKEEDAGEQILQMNRDVICVTYKGKRITAKTIGQREYVKAIKNNTVIFGIGPAGTGKTFLAVAMAYAAYKAGKAEKIILTRPALEAGEKLGFLPGDLQEKVDPYLRPLYDALSEMFSAETYLKLMEKGVIEIAPLAYMRGRTLSNAFIILDEAQNATVEQMKMFLTRLGFNSKMLITGDITQIDLPDYRTSGLNHAAKLLDNVEEIAVCRLTEKDVVRHELVQRIILAYSKEQ